MKMMIKIAAVLQVIILGCTTLLYGSLFSVDTENGFPRSSSDVDHSSYVSSHLYFPVSNGQELFGHNNLPSAFRCNHLLNFDKLNRVKELLFENAGTKYIFYSTCIINISLIPTDIIFPFNYFW